MIYRLILSIAFIIPFSVSAQSIGDLKDLSSSDAMKSVSDSVGGSLTDILQSQLSLDKNQVEGGLGSLLSLANENLDASEFAKFSEMIPGADKYMAAAKSLGAVSGPLKDVAGLNNALGSLGISPDMASRFVPTITDYLGELGGADTKGLLMKALGG